MRSIAVACDPQESGNALPFANHLARRLQGRLLIEPAPRGDADRPSYVVTRPRADDGRLPERLRQSALAARGRRPEPGAAGGGSTARSGPVEPRPDLIVLSSFAARDAGAYTLGAGAPGVLQSAEVPCLVARGELSLPLRRVLLPVDFSDLDNGLIPLAAHWMTSYLRSEAEAGNPSRSLELHVLHVASDAVEERLMDIELAGEIRRTLEEADAKPAVSIRKLVHPAPDAVTEILRVAERHTIDLILLRAFHRRSWIRRPAASVSAAVLRRAECPLVLLPPRLWTRAAEPVPAAG